MADRTPAAVLDAVELGHGAGAVQGDAGLRAFLVRLHEDGGHHAALPSRRGVDVDFAERFDHMLRLGP